MQALAAFILRGRPQAVALIVLTVLLPVLNLGSGAALALVTLRKGPQEGMLLPQTLLLLGLLGVVDAWVDVRARIAAPTGTA